MTKKISDLPLPPEVRHLLLVAQKKGIDVMGGKLPIYMDAAAVTLIGIAAFMTEHNIGGINEIVSNMEEAK